MKRVYQVLIILAFFNILSCSQQLKEPEEIYALAESYVKLILAIAEYDDGFVDSYFGPEDWKPTGKVKKSPPYDEFKNRLDHLQQELTAIDSTRLSDAASLRRLFLMKQIEAAQGRLRILMGDKMTFTEETKLLYDIELPPFDKEYFDSLLNELDKVLPDKGDIVSRFYDFQEQMLVPEEKVVDVFNRGMARAREYVENYLEVDEDNSVSIEIVHNRPWTADCRYRGDGHSHMKFNLDNPFYLDEAITFPCHEIFPGHHFQFINIENQLVRKSNWMEFTVIPFYSPLAAFQEGMAEYGIRLTFPRDKWITFIRDELCPLVGVDTSLIKNYYRIWDLKYRLYQVESYITRDYLTGVIDADEAKRQLEKYCIYGPNEVADRIDNYETYGSYVINYYVGINMIENYINNKVGDSRDVADKWKVFGELLKMPRPPSALQ